MPRSQSPEGTRSTGFVLFMVGEVSTGWSRGSGMMGGRSTVGKAVVVVVVGGGGVGWVGK